jgi:hypothetical protein
MRIKNKWQLRKVGFNIVAKVDIFIFTPNGLVSRNSAGTTSLIVLVLKCHCSRCSPPRPVHFQTPSTPNPHPDSACLPSSKNRSSGHLGIPAIHVDSHPISNSQLNFFESGRFLAQRKVAAIKKGKQAPLWSRLFAILHDAESAQFLMKRRTWWESRLTMCKTCNPVDKCDTGKMFLPDRNCPV